MTDFKVALEDAEAIEAAGFDYQIKLLASVTVISLRYLHHLATELGKPLDQINRDDVIAAFKAEQTKHAGPVA